MTAAEAYQVAQRVAALHLTNFPHRDEVAIRGVAKAVVRLTKQDSEVLIYILRAVGSWRGSSFRRVISGPIDAHESLAEYAATEIYNHKIGGFVRLSDEILSAGYLWEGHGTLSSKVHEMGSELRSMAQQKTMPRVGRK